jgi:hypothetical protein
MGSLKSSSCREHARGVAAPHHILVTVDVGEAAPLHSGSLPPRESPMRHFAHEDHGAVAEAVHGFKEVGAKRVARAVVVPEGIMQLFLLPALAGATGLRSRAMHVAGGKRVDEGETP